MELQEILGHFDGVKRCSEDQYMARCPCHDDKKQSLSIGRGRKGVVLKCQAGCDTRDILARVGLQARDLFYDKPQPRKKIVATYDYPNGVQKLRYSDKSFSWRRPNGKGGWIWNRQGVQPSLYIAGELEGVTAVTEGEKDANNLHRLGWNAVSGEDGAGPGKWKAAYTEQLKGLTVCIFQDNDNVGKAYAQETAAALHGNAARVCVLDLSQVWPEMPEHGDVSDLIVKFGDEKACELIAGLIRDAEEWTEQEEDTTPDDRISIKTVDCALKELGITLRYNQLLKEAEVSGLPECYSTESAVNVLPVYLMDYLKACGYKGVTQQILDGCLYCIADQNRYNPVKEFLESGQWDSTDRMPEIYRILGVTSPRHQSYIRKWFIQCVALGLNEEKAPIGADGVLVLQGEQGLAKTSFFRIMSPFPRWFVEGAIIDMGNKDTLITALSGWITELGELDSTLKKEQASLKAFITLQTDSIRVPYARTPTRSSRRTSFCGTVNPKDYLKDESGSRRFWTVPVTAIDKKALFSLPREWVNQVWYQAHQMYLENPQGFRLSDAEIAELQNSNREFEQPLPYETEIMAMLDYTMPIDKWEWWRSADLAKYMPGSADARKVGKALTRIVKTQPTLTHLTHLNAVKFTKLMDGNVQFLIPLHHLESHWKRGSGLSVLKVD